jgi:hypothetical protein
MVVQDCITAISHRPRHDAQCYVARLKACPSSFLGSELSRDKHRAHDVRRSLKACVRAPFPSSVPEGRLNLAQDVTPGYTGNIDSVPEGRLKVVQDHVTTCFQPSLRDSVVRSNPTQD